MKDTRLDVIEKFNIVAVATVDEGAFIRNLGYKKDIFILNQPYKSEIKDIVENNLIVEISSNSFLTELGKDGRNVKVHIEIGTGMGRTGRIIKQNKNIIEKFQSEMKNYKEEFRSKLPKIYSKELLESLFYEVYTKISYIEKACDVTRITATSYLNQLEEIGLLESEKIGREKLYKNTRLIKLLSEN